jgi:hypothetical protein
MRSLVCALALVAPLLLAAACGSDAAPDDLAPSDGSAPADLAAAPDFAQPPDLAGCGPGCSTADFIAKGIAPNCGTAMMQGTICNHGTAASTTAAFYYLQTGDTSTPGDVSPQAMLLCTVKTVTLLPGACSTTGCAPPAGWTGTNLPNGDYWMRVNDDGKTFPLATECCTGDDVTGIWIDCTLP